MPRRQIPKAKTQKGKRVLINRAPKLVENTKQCFFIRGMKTTNDVTIWQKDIARINKSNALLLQKRNDVHPFESDVFLEKFSRKLDCSLFSFVSNSKKRPDNIIIGRMFDHHVLDMVEFGLSSFKSMKEVMNKSGLLNTSIAQGTKPLLLFKGTPFLTDTTLMRIKNLLTDFFRGESPEKLRLQGIELAITFTALSATEIKMMTYAVELRNSGMKIPRIELVEIGPLCILTLRRHKLASEDLAKVANRQPKEIKVVKRKNEMRDVFGSDRARIHVGKQRIDAIQTRKHKSIKLLKQAAKEDDDDEIED